MGIVSSLCDYCKKSFKIDIMLAQHDSALHNCAVCSKMTLLDDNALCSQCCPIYAICNKCNMYFIKSADEQMCSFCNRCNNCNSILIDDDCKECKCPLCDRIKDDTVDKYCRSCKKNRCLKCGWLMRNDRCYICEPNECIKCGTNVCEPYDICIACCGVCIVCGVRIRNQLYTYVCDNCDLNDILKR